MGTLNSVKLNVAKALGGVSVDYAAGIKLIIASSQGEAYRKARTALLAPHRKTVRRGAMDSEQMLDLLKPVIAEHLLVGWENLTDDDGAEITYSKEQALDYFNDPTLADMFDFVVETSSTQDLFREGSVEQSVKNS
jgi:hypothetical protein